MANVTRRELIDAVRGEYEGGFTYDDALYARVVRAIETVNPDDVRNADISDIEDESTLDDAALVALTIDFHYGRARDLIDD
jgi:hypothetical protein